MLKCRVHPKSIEKKLEITKPLSEKYICKLPAPLIHLNTVLTEALQVLADNAELSTEESRCLAFHRAITVLKSLPFKVTSHGQIKDLKALGEHSKRVIQEILSEGRCDEVEEIRSSEWFRTAKVFQNVYGAGPSTIEKWYSAGYRTISDLKATSYSGSRKDKRIDLGIAFYDDLNTPVTLEESKFITKVVHEISSMILPGIQSYLTGGFRRGKETGHDVDILLSHEECLLEEFLDKLIDKLVHEGYILHYMKHYVKEGRNPRTSKSNTMDDFDKGFIVFSLPKDQKEFPDSFQEKHTILNNMDLKSLCAISSKPRTWRACRVDLICVPKLELPFALIGWTGNKWFNRSLREYALKELGYRLTSHLLYDISKNKPIQAESEEEIFKILKLECLPPELRNS